MLAVGAGCPDLEPSGGIWAKRKGEHLFLRCNETNQNWFLTCRGESWFGDVGNCTGGEWAGWVRVWAEGGVGLGRFESDGGGRTQNWFLTCRGENWFGGVGNCTGGEWAGWM